MLMYGQRRLFAVYNVLFLPYDLTRLRIYFPLYIIWYIPNVELIQLDHL